MNVNRRNLTAALLALSLLAGVAAPSFAAGPTKGKRPAVSAKKKSAAKKRAVRRSSKGKGSSFAEQYRRYNDARRVWHAGPVTGPMTWRSW